MIRFFSLLSKPLPVKKRIVYLMSFPKNDNGFLEALITENPTIEIVILFEKNCEEEAIKFKEAGVSLMPISSSIDFLRKAVPILMQAKIILCDNYFPFLAGLYPNKETTIIQIWHANGAIKRFGLEDPTALKRSFFDHLRFKQVYKRFNEYIVGSEMMGRVFQKSYGASKSSIKPLGNPRTDIYFNKVLMDEKREFFFDQYPELKDKKIILYAPTYRNGLEDDYPFDVRRLYQALGNEYAVLMKKHPHVLSRPIANEYKEFFYGDLSQHKIEDLLVVTDILITDYSSIPFDFTLLDNAKNILFYCYDLEEYDQITGLQKDFKEWAPGEIVQTMDELIVQIKKETYNDFVEFNDKWNTYNDGYAIKHLIEHIQQLL
ncbi:CDP-glycerol glycerophosphotransferase family protein [Desemzia incerta]|uniref:CDP-glycerol glycerophosphotransferase family protein n=1 Tax=Desemzia incerta TaxID=82801 RepID=UPI002467F2B2|nr:CDP-glycerol glycerophosphotransferase family protein [Desemzia incerta]